MNESDCLLGRDFAADMFVGNSIHHHMAAVRGVNTAQNLDQRRFSRTIFPQQGDNLTAIDLQ